MYGLFIIDGCTIFSDTLDITRSQIFRAYYQLPICKEPAKKALYHQQMSWLDEYNDDTYEYDDYDSYYDYCNDQSDDNNETEKEDDIQDESIPKITQAQENKEEEQSTNEWITINEKRQIENKEGLLVNQLVDEWIIKEARKKKTG